MIKELRKLNEKNDSTVIKAKPYNIREGTSLINQREIYKFKLDRDLTLFTKYQLQGLTDRS